MKRYKYNDNFVYSGEIDVPVGISPSNTTDIPPLPNKNGFFQIFNLNEWVYIDNSKLNDYLIKPKTNTVISKLDFINRFTDLEMTGILTASKTDVDIELWIKKLDAATEIDLTDSRTMAGVENLETKNLISVGRAAEILTV